MSETVQKIFSEELVEYETKKSELLRLCPGKCAVLKGKEFLGVFDTPQAAYSAGIEKYGNVPFLIQLVQKEERVEQAPALFLGVLHACR